MNAMDLLKRFLISQDTLPAETTLRWERLLGTAHLDVRICAEARRQVLELLEEGWRGAELAFLWAGLVEEAVNARGAARRPPQRRDSAPYAAYEVVSLAA
jgi:hypothetical protein